MRNMANDDNNLLRMAIIAGAAHAMKYKEKKFKATEQEILQHISDNMDEIIGNLNKEY